MLSVVLWMTGCGRPREPQAASCELMLQCLYGNGDSTFSYMSKDDAAAFDGYATPDAQTAIEAAYGDGGSCYAEPALADSCAERCDATLVELCGDAGSPAEASEGSAFQTALCARAAVDAAVEVASCCKALTCAAEAP